MFFLSKFTVTGGRLDHDPGVDVRVDRVMHPDEDEARLETEAAGARSPETGQNLVLKGKGRIIFF
jgi:hypothetical protein